MAVLQRHRLAAVVLIVAGVEAVLADILLQLGLAGGLTGSLIRLYLLELIVVLAEDTLGAGHIAGTVHGLLERGDSHGRIIIRPYEGDAAGVVAAGDGLEGIACEFVVENPEVAPNAHLLCILVFSSDQCEGGDANVALCVLTADFLHQVVADGVVQELFRRLFRHLRLFGSLLLWCGRGILLVLGVVACRKQEGGTDEGGDSFHDKMVLVISKFLNGQFTGG